MLFVERSTARRVTPHCSETTMVEELVELRMRLTSTEAQVERGSEKNSGRWTFWLVRNRVADQYVSTAILFLTRCELFLERNSSHVDLLTCNMAGKFMNRDRLLFAHEKTHAIKPGHWLKKLYFFKLHSRQQLFFSYAFSSA